MTVLRALLFSLLLCAAGGTFDLSHEFPFNPHIQSFRHHRHGPQSPRDDFRLRQLYQDAETRCRLRLWRISRRGDLDCDKDEDCGKQFGDGTYCRELQVCKLTKGNVCWLKQSDGGECSGDSACLSGHCDTDLGTCVTPPYGLYETATAAATASNATTEAGGGNTTDAATTTEATQYGSDLSDGLYSYTEYSTAPHYSSDLSDTPYTEYQPTSHYSNDLSYSEYGTAYQPTDTSHYSNDLSDTIYSEYSTAYEPTEAPHQYGGDTGYFKVYRRRTDGTPGGWRRYQMSGFRF